MKKLIYLIIILIIGVSAYCFISQYFKKDITFDKQGETITLNDLEEGRGLFTSIIPWNNNQELIVTYQLANFETLSDDKSLYYKRFDRELNLIQEQEMAIDVNKDFWGGDLGDHKFLVLDNIIYMVSLILGHDDAGLIAFDHDFNLEVDEPVFHGLVGEEKFLDMGFATDGEYFYTQYYHPGKDGEGPDEWDARIYKLNKDLEVVDQTYVEPESGSFITGTSLVYVPKGQMGAEQDQFQIFSTNLDYMNCDRVGIHTFAMDKDSLELIPGSTQTIIEEDLDVYFPVGSAWNEKHQIWIVGYTKEEFEAAHGGKNPNCKGSIYENEELGPSYIAIFDSEWNELETIQVNDGNFAFRVMLKTFDDDIYVVYDEMDFMAKAETSASRLEHYKIVTASTP